MRTAGPRARNHRAPEPFSPLPVAGLILRVAGRRCSVIVSTARSDNANFAYLDLPTDDGATDVADQGRDRAFRPATDCASHRRTPNGDTRGEYPTRGCQG